MSALLNGRKGAKEIQQPAPVFFTPEKKQRMEVGYQYKAPEKSAEDRMIDEIRQTMADLRQTANRMKVVLEAREEELANTKAQLRECVKELCMICPDSGRDRRCDTCQWMPVKEEDA